MIRTGSMKHQIVIQSESTQTPDGQGGFVPGYTDIMTRWAKVTELSYDRILLDGGMRFTKVCQFDMRDDFGSYTMSGRYRIYWNDQYFTVHSVVTNDAMTTIIAYV